MFDDDKRIEYFINHIGWITRLRWPSEERAGELARKRDGLLAKLPEGRVRYGSGGSKPYLGSLSPGCRACMDGKWSCLSINWLCTVNCFFCPQNRSVTTEQAPMTEGLRFEEPEGYLDYLEKFGFTGVSFSGGEPLVALDRVLLFARKIRERFGRKMYLWLYTNGSLVDEAVLGQLKEVGIDEIRFNISARGYNLRPVKLARRFIRTVTVETPVIPEDLEKLKGSLFEMEAIGVDFLNVHQLIATRNNVQNLQAREYTFLRPLAFHEAPMFESEMAALELLRFSAENRLSLPINYCSHVYKARFQTMAHRYRAAALACEGYEQVTEAGYIRRLSVVGEAADVAGLTAVFRQNGIADGLWSAGENGTELRVHGSLLGWVGVERFRLSVGYFEAELVPQKGSKTVGSLTLNGDVTVFVNKVKRGQPQLFSGEGAKLFRQLFIDGNNIAGEGGVSNINLLVGGAVTPKMAETLLKVKEWEWVAVGFPEIA